MTKLQFPNNKEPKKFELDDRDWKIIEARVVAARDGVIASDKEVRDVFDRCRGQSK